MTNQKPDPLVETLMQLAASAAPLIRRARDSGLFRDMGAAAKPAEDTVDATVVKKAAAPKAEASPDTAALQALLVRQALRISELEAEVAALKAKAKPKPKPAAKKRPAK